MRSKRYSNLRPWHQQDFRWPLGCSLCSTDRRTLLCMCTSNHIINTWLHMLYICMHPPYLYTMDTCFMQYPSAHQETARANQSKKADHGHPRGFWIHHRDSRHVYSKIAIRLNLLNDSHYGDYHKNVSQYKCGVSHGFPTMSVDHVPRKTHGFSMGFPHLSTTRGSMAALCGPQGVACQGHLVAGRSRNVRNCSHITMDMTGILDWIITWFLMNLQWISIDIQDINGDSLEIHQHDYGKANHTPSPILRT